MTIDVDGIAQGYLHESKFIDSASGFYSKQIGSLGTGLELHISKWGSELQRLSIAAEQYGYNGVKVFVNDAEAIRIAQNLFGNEEWFRLVEIIYQVAK